MFTRCARSLPLAPGLQAAMQSFDERGAGRRIAANLDEEYGDYEDAGGADDYGGGAHYGGGGNDTHYEAAGAHKQQAYGEEEEAPKVSSTGRHVAHLAPRPGLSLGRACPSLPDASPSAACPVRTRTAELALTGTSCTFRDTRGRKFRR